MLYAILCYHDEDLVGSWTREQDAAVMTKLAVVQDKLKKQGRLGPNMDSMIGKDFEIGLANLKRLTEK